MQFDWRTTLGPGLTMAVALTAFLVDHSVVTVPNPAPLFVCIVALASSISGVRSGLASAAIAVIFSALFFLNHRAAPGYDAHEIVLIPHAAGRVYEKGTGPPGCLSISDYMHPSCGDDHFGGIIFLNYPKAVRLSAKGSNKAKGVNRLELIVVLDIEMDWEAFCTAARKGYEYLGAKKTGRGKKKGGG